MKILHVITDLGPGGAELMMKRLIGRLGGGESTHVVLSLREKSTVGVLLEKQGVEVVALGMRGLGSAPGALVRLVRNIRRVKPDIVQTWLYHADLIGGLGARWAGIRRVVWGIRSTQIPPGRGTAAATSAIRRVCALLSRRVPLRIVFVAEAARSAHEQLGYDRSRSIVIPNGYDMPVLPSPEDKAVARRRFGLPENSIVIGSAGRYNALKDYPSFIVAAAMVAQQRADVRFLIAGRGLDAANRELAAAIDGTGFADRFHLVGEQEGLSSFLSVLDLFCLHSIVEGFPNVVAEAMAMSVPCAVTDAGDAALIVGDTGLVVPPEQPERMAEALQRLIAEGERARKHRGDLARARIADNFSMDAVAARYEALYAGVMRDSLSASLPELRGRARPGTEN